VGPELVPFCAALDDRAPLLCLHAVAEGALLPLQQALEACALAVGASGAAGPMGPRDNGGGSSSSSSSSGGGGGSSGGSSGGSGGSSTSTQANSLVADCLRQVGVRIRQKTSFYLYSHMYGPNLDF
jgi:hypothetical protein